MSYGEDEEKVICRLSPLAHPHTLSRRAGNKPPAGCFAGGEKELLYNYEDFHYHCTTCDLEFHKDCYMSPRKMTHPYHPQHPIIFCANSKSGIIYDCDIHDRWHEVSIIVGILNPGNIFDKCTWCGNNTTYNFYRCSLCSFCLCLDCSQTFPPPTIKNPKCHHHPLFFLPRPLLLPCDVCGLVEQSKQSYACFQCNFVVHRGCIDLPRVIKLTRHPHRLFYTPFLSHNFSLCRLCYKPVDNKYGQYLCNHDDCSYVVHSMCATHKNVWDGRELEWEPEDFGESSEDVEPFKNVGDGLIKYFCHEHHLKLEKYDRVRDSDKQCQACILHIDSRDFYNCVQCDFFLHEVCANLPRKLDHALHHHPLVLDPVPKPHDTYFKPCDVCDRYFNGFSYKCSKRSCQEEYSCRKFQLDVRCILVPDCFTHKIHKHPLFIPIYTGRGSCMGCKDEYCVCYLKCTLCEFSLCYKCATIPDKLHYKYEALPLSLCYGEASDETYWCEVCEKKLDPRKWFYTCDKTDITIHIDCVFGPSVYIKPGSTFHVGVLGVAQVLCNNSNTRPICYECGSRCSSSVYFKFSNGSYFCSFSCYYEFDLGYR